MILLCGKVGRRQDNASLFVFLKWYRPPCLRKEKVLECSCYMKKTLACILLLFSLSACGFKHFQFVTMPGGQVVRLKLAVSAEEKARGLGGIKSMPDFDGMLFIYNEPQQVDFWMYNMNFPLDIVYLDGNKQVLEINEKQLPCASAEECPSILSGSTDVKFVVEVPAGQADKYMIVENAKLAW